MILSVQPVIAVATDFFAVAIHYAVTVVHLTQVKTLKIRATTTAVATDAIAVATANRGLLSIRTDYTKYSSCSQACISRFFHGTFTAYSRFVINVTEMSPFCHQKALDKTNFLCYNLS